MISGRLNFRELDAQVLYNGNTVKIGQSNISILQHVRLQHMVAYSEKYILVFVREKSSKRFDEDWFRALLHKLEDEELLNLHKHLLEWPLLFMCFLVTRDRFNSAIQVSVGDWATAPVYYYSNDEFAEFSQNICNFDSAHLSHLDHAAVARFITLQPVEYDERTLFSSIKRLTPRSTVSITKSGAVIRLVEVETIIGPDRISDERDVKAEFMHLLGKVLKRYNLETGKFAIEVSGGLDSAIVALSAGSLTSNIFAHGAIVVGDTADEQASRRTRLLSVLGLNDIQAYARDHLPFVHGLRRSSRRNLGYFEETYYELFEALTDSIVKNGADTILTGTGGDELFPLYLGEVQKERPRRKRFQHRRYGNFHTRKAIELGASTLQAYRREHFPAASTSAAIAARAPRMISNGLWSINPLASRDLARFTYALPWKWRENRYLFRSILTDAGMPFFKTIKRSISATRCLQVSRRQKAQSFLF